MKRDISGKPLKITKEEEERKRIRELLKCTNEIDYTKLHQRLEMRTPLPPVTNRGNKDDKHKRLIDQRKNNSQINKMMLMNDKGSDCSSSSNIMKKSMQLNEKISIECSVSPNKQLKTTKSVSLFNLSTLDNYQSSDDDNDNNPFNKMVQRQKESEFFALTTFLKSINLLSLFQQFIKGKVYENEEINALTEEQLISMKITKENRKKILDKVYYNTHPEEKQVEDERINDTGVQSNAIDKEDDIVDPEENERIQAELFKKAVEEFRKGRPDYVPPPKEEEQEQPKVNPKKFLANLGSFELFNLDQVSLFQDQGNDFNEDKEYLAELAIGRACWGCYRKISIAYPLQVDGKYFCKEECMKEYHNDNEVKCDFCNKNYYKNNGLFAKANKFCSVDCYKKDRNKIVENAEEEDDEPISTPNQPIEKMYLDKDFDILDI